jgi:secretion/DNA translocation related CpaE-like protein
VLVIAGVGEIQELVLATAAALDLVAVVAVDLDVVAKLWNQVGTVCVAEDFAALTAAWALPRRGGVVLLGGSEVLLAKWSAPLDAKVIPLPAGALWLGSILDESAGKTGTPVLAVLGGSGGVGASTLAAGVALAAAKTGRQVALVDVDVVGGGIDLLLGVEHEEGWRWPSLASAEGYVGDLCEYLPKIAGVSVVSMARNSAEDLASEPLTAILHSLRRSHEVVVVDVGRSLSSACREAVRLATDHLMLVSPSIRGIAGARQVLRTFQLESATETTPSLNPAVVHLVLRGKGAAGFGATTLGETLGCPVIARLEDDPTVVAAAARGDLPWGRPRGGFRKTCSRLASALIEG